MNLLFRLSDGNRRLELLRTSKSARPPRPSLLPDPTKPAPMQLGDIVLTLHDTRNKRLAEHVLPATHMTFFDRPLKPSGEVIGRIATWMDAVRSLDVSIPPQATRLTLARHALDASSKSLLVPLLELDPRADPSRRGRRIPKAPTQLHGERGDASKSFDIVILGDGFQKQEMKLFGARARFLVSELLAIEPFKSLSDRINVHAVFTPSKDSGVTNCPHPGVRKNTFFEIEGNFKDAGYAGYFGTHRTDIIDDAAESVAPRELIDLVIVLVNSAIYGGRGDRESRTCYVPIVADDELFINLAVHEAAHAICGLTDEYISDIAPPIVGFKAPNFATEAERLTNEVCWRGLAHGFELDQGVFRATHRIGDPLDHTAGSPVLPNGLGDMLGLFWGCSFIEPTPPSDGFMPHRFDVRGGGYYRPMARCKMRKLSDPFCRVCANALRLAIEEAAAVGSRSSR